jgi:tetratricopeptide (TPR) repeat protein
MNLPIDSRILKITLAAGAIAYAVQLFVSGYTGSGVGMTLIGIIIGLTAMRSIRMILVAFRIQQQKLDKARQTLSGINPKHLWPGNRGQYWFLQGNLLLESSLTEAEKAFRTALDVGMKRDEEKAAVMLNLAAIQSSKRRTKEAKALIAQAKRLDKKGMLKADIRTIEQAIKNPQQVLRRR